MFIDTHAHLYDQAFEESLQEDIQRAIRAGVGQMLLPNCDKHTIGPMLALAQKWPQVCIPMMGLHPCYVKDGYEAELETMRQWLDKETFCAIGEIGLDYHWDRTFVREQKKALDTQIGWALEYDLPIVLHSRDSLPDVIDLVSKRQNGKLKGVFHCFGGSLEEARQIIDLGFYLGIGGVVTFKSSQLPQVLAEIDLEHLVLETDAPYLAPVPYRGKRNESAYIPMIAEKIASIKACSLQEVADRTTAVARKLFALKD